MIEKRHTRLEESAERQTREIIELLNSNTSLTQQDKELTEQVARLTHEIHAALTKQKS